MKMQRATHANADCLVEPAAVLAPEPQGAGVYNALLLLLLRESGAATALAAGLADAEGGGDARDACDLMTVSHRHWLAALAPWAGRACPDRGFAARLVAVAAALDEIEDADQLEAADARLHAVADGLATEAARAGGDVASPFHRDCGLLPLVAAAIHARVEAARACAALAAPAAGDGAP